MSAEQLLPLWVRLAPWLVGPAYGLLAACSVALALRLIAKPPAEPWTERARVIMPARQLVLMARLLFAICAALFVISLRAPGVGRSVWTVACAFFGAVLPALRWEDRLAGRSSPGPGLRSFAARGVSFIVVLPVLVAPTLLVGRGAAVEVVGVLASCALLFWGLSGGGFTLATWLGLARPARPKVRAAVERAAARMNVRVRRLLELDWLFANAFALPLANDVAFTKPMEELLPEDELEAVASHELGHLSEPLRFKLARPGAVLVLFAALVVFFRVGSYTVEAVLGLLGLLFVVLVVRTRVGRAAERHADAAALGSDGPAFARALERIYAFNHIPAVLRRAGAHGHLYDRMVAAGVTPSWPKPPPPQRAPFGARLVVVGVAMLPVVWLVGFLPNPRTVDEAYVRLAIGQRSVWSWEQLGRAALNGGDVPRGVAFYEAAVEADPTEPFVRGALVMAYARAGRCAEARDVYAAATAMAQETQRRDVGEVIAAAEAELNRSCADTP